MKNKSKLAKIRKPKQPDYPKDWLYMCEKELELVALKERLEGEYSVEYWEEAGVLEVELNEEATVDFETVALNRADDVTKDFMETKGIKTVFLVSIRPEHFEASKIVMEKITGTEGGFFCGDTADFTPVVKNV